MAKLTVKTMGALKTPGMYADGGGLYLRVGPTGSKSWILRTVIQGRRRELGLGGASWMTLAEAREAAASYRKVARQGGDPDAERKEELRARVVAESKPTFEEATRKYHATLSPTFRSERHSTIWLGSLEAYAFPHFGKRRIDTISTPDILKALSPIWTAKNNTARRLRQRISSVFKWAKGAGHYSGENPVDALAGKESPLTGYKPSVEHMAALPWRDVPAFMRDLAQRDAVSATCLAFLILTASRSGEARGARWEEIDTEAGVWTIPASRMKAKTAHRIPLALESLALLERVKDLDAVLVFPSPQRGSRGEGRELSINAFWPLFDRMRVRDITVHGFRSAFRDWCGDSAKVEREVAEAALAHQVGNSVERAYARSDLFDRRRGLMDAWAAFATGKAEKVVQLVRA